METPQTPEERIQFIELVKVTFSKKTKTKNYNFLGKKTLPEIAKGCVDMINASIDKKVKTVFFLDKAARPFGYIFLELWEKLYPGMEPPELKFINIGRRSQSADELSENHCEILRRRYSINSEESILIVDDYAHSGETFKKTDMILRKLYPDSKIYLLSLLSDIPIWYGAVYQLGVDEVGLCQDPMEKYMVKPYGFGKDKKVEFRRELRDFAEIIADSVEYTDNIGEIKFFDAENK